MEIDYKPITVDSSERFRSVLDIIGDPNDLDSVMLRLDSYSLEDLVDLHAKCFGYLPPTHDTTRASLVDAIASKLRVFYRFGYRS